jgi:Group II intron, maturase-specific domain
LAAEPDTRAIPGKNPLRENRRLAAQLTELTPGDLSAWSVPPAFLQRFVQERRASGKFRAAHASPGSEESRCNRAEEALVKMRNMMSKLKLTVNDTKTRVCKLPEEKFDFLRYTFGRCYSPKTGRAYLGITPSQKRVQRICEAISRETGRNKTLLTQEMEITTLNPMMVGWANYFCLGSVSKAYRAVERHARKRLRQWLCAAGTTCVACIAGTNPKRIAVRDAALTMKIRTRKSGIKCNPGDIKPFQNRLINRCVPQKAPTVPMTEPVNEIRKASIRTSRNSCQRPDCP